jgi:hypothetical protein
MESVGELAEVARTANWRRGGDEWLMASDGGRQAANSGIPMCYYCCLSRKAKKSPYIISIREGTQGEDTRDLLGCVLCAAESCLLGLFFTIVWVLYMISV